MGRLANKPLCKPLYRLWESQTVRDSNLECTVWVAHSRRRDFHHLRTHGTRCNRLHIARLSGLLNTNIILSFTIFGRFHCPASERSLHIDLEKRNSSFEMQILPVKIILFLWFFTCWTRLGSDKTGTLCPPSLSRLLSDDGRSLWSCERSIWKIPSSGYQSANVRQVDARKCQWAPVDKVSNWRDRATRRQGAPKKQNRSPDLSGVLVTQYSYRVVWRVPNLFLGQPVWRSSKKTKDFPVRSYKYE